MRVAKRILINGVKDLAAGLYRVGAVFGYGDPIGARYVNGVVL